VAISCGSRWQKVSHRMALLFGPPGNKPEQRIEAREFKAPFMLQRPYSRRDGIDRQAGLGRRATAGIQLALAAAVVAALLILAVVSRLIAPLP
jgi:hypothetical protein